jgi:beta-xylosidase
MRKPFFPILLAGSLLCMTGITCLLAERRQKPMSPTYTNPVINQNFPDPSILSDGGIFYAYATNAGPNMLCARSTDLVHWTILPDAMPTLPTWAAPGHTWAPNVCAFVPGKRYIAYFCAHDRAANTQSIGVATSLSPAGPFTSDASAPLIREPDLGGAIDPSCSVGTDGSRYLVWKNDGNSRGLDTWLWIQKLSADGLSLIGTQTRLIKQDQSWEGQLIEAPTLWKHHGNYYLFYSANSYANCSYAIGYAVSDTLLGPYVKPRATPWQASTDSVCGPGGEDILATEDGRTYMVYHAWEHGPHTYRSMSIDPLVWNGDVPYLLGPSRWPQPVPDLK